MSGANPGTWHEGHKREQWGVNNFRCAICGGYGQTAFLARGRLRLGWVETWEINTGVRRMFDRMLSEPRHALDARSVRA